MFYNASYSTAPHLFTPLNAARLPKSSLRLVSQVYNRNRVKATLKLAPGQNRPIRSWRSVSVSDALHDYLQQLSGGGPASGGAYIAAALLDACYDGDTWRWPELSHLRTILHPARAELVALASVCQGRMLVAKGLADRHPMLALANRAVLHHYGRYGDRAGRMLMVASLGEIAAADTTMVRTRPFRDVASAVRIEIKELARNPTARQLLPDLRSPYDLIAWFGTARGRFADQAITAWTRHVGPALLGALQHPAVSTASETREIADDDPALDAVAARDTTTAEAADEDTPATPASWWIIEPADEDDAPASASPSIREEAMAPSLSTYVLARHLTVASPTYLPDADVEAIVREHVDRATEAATRGDRAALGSHLMVLIAVATGTQLRHLRGLRWAAANSEPAVDGYPGTISADGCWLYRPQIDPSGRMDAAARPPVHIPMPSTVTRLMVQLRAGNTQWPRAMVFGNNPMLDPLVIRLRDVPVPHASLHRALISRLVRDRRYGATLAQYVAGDDLGADIAPLHYDRIPASDVAHAVARITYAWFGARHTLASQPTHDLGSIRVPTAQDVASVISGLRDAVGAAKTLEERVYRRTHYLVHGLCLHTGHRPNNQFQNITIRDISPTDGIAMLRDKVAGADWMVRPVALAPSWAAEYTRLLQDLQAAAERSPITTLGKLARMAVSGAGPIFLAPRNDESVGPYGINDYLTGLPQHLCAFPNFARHYANHALTRLLPVWLRVAQMGWHGTWDSAFSDGSTWSVLHATSESAQAVESVLRSVGWRRTNGEAAATATFPRAAPTSWVRLERHHEVAYRLALRSAKRAAASRREQAHERCLPRLAATLPMLLPGLELVGREIRLASDANEPVEVPRAKLERLISAGAAGDMRTLDAIAARMLVRDLIADARQRGVVRGPIPRGVTEHWPTRPGPFSQASACALDVARAIDAAVVEAGSTVARTIVTLLLYGCYGSLRASLAVMSPGTRLSTLESMPGVLLAEPPANPCAPDGQEPWLAGTTVWYDMAALELDRWHRSPRDVDLAAIDAELGQLLQHHLSRSDRRPLGWLREVEALARACNTLRLDGWSRLVGTGQVEPASTDISRIVALHEDWPATPRAAGHVPVSTEPPDKGPSRSRRAPDTIDRLLASMSAAISRTESNRRQGSNARARLVADIRDLLAASSTTTPTDLIVLYPHYLLLYGGKRRETLALETIARYVRAAIPLVQHLPADPLGADGETWTAALMAAVADADKHLRPERAELLGYFVWRLSEVMLLPADIDFGAVRAFAGRPRDRVDAGYFTYRELQLLLDALQSDIDALSNAAGTPEDILTGRQRRLCFLLMAAGALRSGEASGLIVRDTLRRSDGRLSLAPHSQQRLKNANARRCPRLLSLNTLDPLTEVESELSALRIRCGREYSATTPLLHASANPVNRASDATIWPRISSLVKWVTGNPDAVPYWARKTGVRTRLHEIMSAPAGSLWATRELLAEIGHSDPRVTLGAYTHDPVLIFLRQIVMPLWQQPSATRIAAAAGVSASTVQRTYGSRRLAAGPRAVAARIAALMHSRALRPPAALDDAHLTAPPLPAVTPTAWTPTAAEVDAVLVDIADGASAATATAARNWPATAAIRLRDAITTLRAEHGVIIYSGRQRPTARETLVPPPRRMRRSAGILTAAHDPKQASVLADMCETWLSGLAHGDKHAIVTTSAIWERWLDVAPALASIPWVSSTRAGTREAFAIAISTDTICLTTTLRWGMLVAWAWRACDCD